jgi:hypothetical protein
LEGIGEEDGEEEDEKMNAEQHLQVGTKHLIIINNSFEH